MFARAELQSLALCESPDPCRVFIGTSASRASIKNLTYLDARLGLAELAGVLVRLDHITNFIVNANHRIV
jgi:hypothetical protein